MNITPEKNSNTEDCMFCRVTGTLVFGSLSFYSFLKFLQAEKRTGDKKFFGLISLCFSFLAIYRASSTSKPILNKTTKNVKQQ
ncbi:conserved Plasmodium protein, unknown function [Plasmodium malariae]|uniref:DUF4536 domain-containing protein n=1 Tax=Plasmodium malariae TaxID=5858 RepID=A0A1D3PC27_PLAMA|nr:conserved Plasmodium protein, unknown function [Plasmodium malariae]SCN12727.1 conserved Plasmodium protein, unknown function [Plasmodium malariae]